MKGTTTRTKTSLAFRKALLKFSKTKRITQYSAVDPPSKPKRSTQSSAIDATSSVCGTTKMSKTDEFNTNLPNVRNPRLGFTAAALREEIFFVGGSECTSGEIYDISTQKWASLRSMSAARTSGAAVSFSDSIIMIGGSDESGKKLSSVEEYNTKTNCWSSFPAMNTKRDYFAAVVLNGNIFVAGGHSGDDYLASAEMYSTSTGRWGKIASMHIKRKGCAAAVMGGQLYVIGGFAFDGRKIKYLSSAEVYDPATNKWTLIADVMSTPRAFCAAASLGRKIAVVGGHDGSKALSSCEAYDTTAQHWSVIAPMHTKRYGCAAVEVGGTLYVMGGSNDGRTALPSMESLKLRPSCPRPSASRSPVSQPPASRSPTSRSQTSWSKASQPPTSQSPTSRSPTSRSPTSRSPTSRSPTSRSPASRSSAQMPTAPQVHQVPPTQLSQTMQPLQDIAPSGDFIPVATVVPAEVTEVVSYEEESISQSLGSISLNNLSDASTEEICHWLSKHRVSTASLDVIRREEIDGVFLFTESFNTIYRVLKEEGMKAGQISRIHNAVKEAKKEGSFS